MKKSEPTQTTERFARRLRAMRIPRGFKTARSFAAALGIHENRYTRYERAEVEPDLETLMRICDTLGASPNDLLCETIGLTPDAAMPGFSEHPQANVASPPLAPAVQSATLRFQAEAMALANQLATLVLRRETGTEPDPGAVLKSAGELFHRISTSPFSVLPEIGSTIAVASADLETQRRIAAHITAIVDLLRAMPNVGEQEN